MLLGGKKKPLSAVMLLYVLLDRTTVHTAAVLFCPTVDKLLVGFVLAASGGSRMECLYIQQHSTIGSLLKKSV